MRTEKEMAWKTLKSEYLFRRPWLTARRDAVQLPDGRTMDEYYVLEYPDWINVIAVTADGKILLERQWRHALGELSTEIVAGVMEAGETPLEAAQRELQEETGYTGGTWRKLMTLAPNSSTMNNHCHCFLAEGVVPAGETHFDAVEDLEVMLCERSEVFRMLQEGVFHQALMTAPLWRYFAENK